MKVVRHSKPSKAVIANKQSFFKKNKEHLAYVRSVNDLYLKQPKRRTCKTCGLKLGAVDITIHGVPYAICERCNHFNGLHEDTESFASFVYTDADGNNYAKNYKKDYFARVNDIYEPKVSFLADVLKSQGVSTCAVTDVGCGAGHFVAACEKLEIDCVGYDTNLQLVDLGNQYLSKNRLHYSELNDINQLILDINTPVMSLIGVMEHLMDPIGAMRAFSENGSEYCYLQVPLFSFSAILESIHPDVFPRQLNAGHTHLYTERSLKYICDQFDFEIVGEWWFGTDIVDLFRHMHIKVESNSDRKSDIISNLLGAHIDELQAVLDSKKVCSGVNMVIKKRR